ncbi:MAG: hypothetical protein NZ707_07805, partial [Rhodospirillales bacterium]|nr:hypothetical protein [Rhodospirillales bacterium]
NVKSCWISSNQPTSNLCQLSEFRGCYCRQIEAAELLTDKRERLSTSLHRDLTQMFLEKV